jgi:hypothetical protein
MEEPLLDVAHVGAAASTSAPRTALSSGAALRVDAISAARALLLALLGSVVVATLTWLPPFLVDLLWLAVYPPASQDSMRAVNIVVAILMPMVVVFNVRRCLARREAAAAAAEGGAEAVR